MCTQKSQSLRSLLTFFFFPFLQVALSLEDHSSEVQVVKHLLHVCPHLPSPLQPLQGSSASTPMRCTVSLWGPRRRLGARQAREGQKMSQSVPCSVNAMKIPQPRMSLVSVLLTNVLLGTRADHSRCRWVNQSHIHALAAVLGADDLCHPFWPGLTQQLPWESVWIWRPSLKALRTEDVHSVV